MPQSSIITALHLVAISVGHAANGGSLRAYIGTYAAIVPSMNGTQQMEGSMTPYNQRRRIAALLTAVHHIIPYDAAILAHGESDDMLTEWCKCLEMEYLANYGKEFTN